MAANGNEGAASELPVAAGNLIEFTPTRYEEGDLEAPVYLIARPTPFLRADIRADLTRMDAKPVHGTQFRRVLREAVALFLTGEALEGALADIDVVEAAEVENPESTAELVQTIIRVEGYGVMAVAHSEDYAELAARHKYFWDVYYILAARYALRGWRNLSRDGKPVKFLRRRRAVTDETLNAVPPDDLKAIGLRVVSLMHVSADQRKN